MDQFAFDPDVSRTMWTFELHRPVVHEHHPDGTVIPHVRPSGGKSAFLNELMEKFHGRKNPSN